MTKKFITKVRSIDDTSNFDDFPDVEIALGELRPEKKDFFSVKHHRHNQQNHHHNRHYQSHHVLGVDGPVNQEEAKESKSKDWMFINYTFKRFPLMLFMQMFMVM